MTFNIKSLKNNESLRIYTLEEDMNCQPKINVYYLNTLGGRITLSYKKGTINHQLKVKEEIETIGTLKNDIYIEGVIEIDKPLVGTFTNGLDFNFSKILRLEKVGDVI